MAPKDKEELSTITNAHAWECSEQYIGESCRTFGGRFRELLRESSPIHLNSQMTGHQVDLECFTIISRETQGATRPIKEAMYI